MLLKTRRSTIFVVKSNYPYMVLSTRYLFNCVAAIHGCCFAPSSSDDVNSSLSFLSPLSVSLKALAWNDTLSHATGCCCCSFCCVGFCFDFCFWPSLCKLQQDKPGKPTLLPHATFTCPDIVKQTTHIFVWRPPLVFTNITSWPCRFLCRRGRV